VKSSSTKVCLINDLRKVMFLTFKWAGYERSFLISGWYIVLLARSGSLTYSFVLLACSYHNEFLCDPVLATFTIANTSWSYACWRSRLFARDTYSKAWTIILWPCAHCARHHPLLLRPVLMKKGGLIILFCMPMKFPSYYCTLNNSNVRPDCSWFSWIRQW
jgi:hypothetical protein